MGVLYKVEDMKLDRFAVLKFHPRWKNADPGITEWEDVRERVDGL